MADQHTGISNRESAKEEEQERQEHPPAREEPPFPRDAAGDDREVKDVFADQTSHKAGARSIAQKEDRARYPDRSAPPTHKVPGAFGREGEPD